MHGHLVWLARRGGQRLAQGHLHAATRLAQIDSNARRAGLFIPAPELAQIDATRIFHSLHPILAGDGLAIVTFEIQIRTAPEAFGPQQRVQHADHLGALVVDGRGVEIGDLDIVIGTDRVRQGPGIFGELHGAQRPHIIDAAHGSAALIGAELLVTENRQPFFQAELEPVAAGDAIAGPIVEIFMRHHPGHRIEILIGGGFGVSQNIFGIEDVDALVLHRAGIEISHGDDVECVQIIFATINPLIPVHAGLQRRHGMGTARYIACRRPDGELHMAAAGRGEFIFQRAQLPGDQREQIGGLGPGIGPVDGVTAAGQILRCAAITIGQQNRKLCLVRLQPHCVAGQDIGSIGEPGDGTEAFRLALRHQPAFAGIKPHQPRVALRVDYDFGFHHRAVTGDRQGQRVAIWPGRHAHAINTDGGGFQRVAIQHQRAIVGAIPLHMQPGLHHGASIIQPEIKLHLRHQPIWLAIIRQAHFGQRRVGSGIKHAPMVRERGAKGKRFLVLLHGNRRRQHQPGQHLPLGSGFGLQQGQRVSVTLCQQRAKRRRPRIAACRCGADERASRIGAGSFAGGPGRRFRRRDHQDQGGCRRGAAGIIGIRRFSLTEQLQCGRHFIGLGVGQSGQQGGQRQAHRTASSDCARVSVWKR